MITEDQLTELLEIAEKLGSTVWDIAMRTAYADIITSGMVGGIVLILLIVIGGILRKKVKENGTLIDPTNSMTMVDMIGIAYILHYFCLLLWLAVFLDNLKKYVTFFVAPEYLAFQKLMELLP